MSNKEQEEAIKRALWEAALRREQQSVLDPDSVVREGNTIATPIRTEVIPEPDTNLPPGRGPGMEWPDDYPAPDTGDERFDTELTDELSRVSPEKAMMWLAALNPNRSLSSDSSKEALDKIYERIKNIKDPKKRNEETDKELERIKERKKNLRPPDDGPMIA